MHGAKLLHGAACRIQSRHHLSATVQASFSFADSKRVRQPQQGRRNRAIEKRQENELRNIVHGLCKMSAKQLQAVSHLLSKDQLKEIKIAVDIPPTNQGRRRQEGLVAKLLRADLDTLELEKLSEAVTVAERNNLPFTDTEVEQQLRYWIEGLLDNQQEVVDEVYQLLQQQNADWQQTRTWVRQLQQHKQEQQQRQHSHNATASSSSSSSTDEAAEAALQVDDHEVQQLMIELAQQQQLKQQTNGQRSSSSKGQRAGVYSARRSIRRMLMLLAIEHCK